MIDKDTIENRLVVLDEDIAKVNPFVKLIEAAKYLLFGTSLNEN